MSTTNAWDWGDGTVEQLPADQLVASHTYADDGEYTIAVTVDGETAQAGVEVPHPVVTSLSPNTGEMGAESFVMTVVGEGFVDGTVIVFNGGDEPTEFVDAFAVTTIVDPTTASGPWTVPVLVRNPDGIESNAVDFSFTEPTPASTRRKRKT